MKLFSKRNLIRPYSIESDIRVPPSFIKRKYEFISSEARNRILSEIKFISSNDDFLEFFILFENEKKNKIFFDSDKIDSFSLSELGYKMSNFFEFEQFNIIPQKSNNTYTKTDDDKIIFYDDYKLFDLMEIVILFSKASKRVEIIERFNIIFSEEKIPFEIVKLLITKKSGETIKTLAVLLKDAALKHKIEIYFDLFDRNDYVNSSKISSDILNILFSDCMKDFKKRTIKVITNKIVKKLLKRSPPTEDIKNKEERLLKYLENLLNIARDLSNDIYDIRHTELSTIKITNDNVYKLISNNNMSIVELVLTTLKDDYVLGEDWEKIKDNYIKKYNIDTKTRWAIKDTAGIDDSNSNEIPF